MSAERSHAVQTTDRILMVRPAAFGFNAQTAQSNPFQQAHTPQTAARDHAAALAEFDESVRHLRAEGVQVCVAADVAPPERPDAIFPNNWVSFHRDGTLVLYPMQAPVRRLERRLEIVEQACAELGFRIGRRVDLTAHESAGRFLEGTGSLVLDHVARVAYACISPRTDRGLVDEWCRQLQFEPVVFDATDAAGRPWYHTNVMLSIGSGFVVIAADSIDAAQRGAVLGRLRASGRAIVEIDRGAAQAFAGNVLELGAWDEAVGDSRVLVLSAAARAGLGAAAYARLAATVDSVVCVPIPTIERLGGGSARCMMAEVFAADG
jgi:hypothetical protein